MTTLKQSNDLTQLTVTNLKHILKKIKQNRNNPDNDEAQNHLDKYAEINPNYYLQCIDLDCAVNADDLNTNRVQRTKCEEKLNEILSNLHQSNAFIHIYPTKENITAAPYIRPNIWANPQLIITASIINTKDKFKSLHKEDKVISAIKENVSEIIDKDGDYNSMAHDFGSDITAYFKQFDDFDQFDEKIIEKFV